MKEISLSRTGNAEANSCVWRHKRARFKCDDVKVALDGSMRRMAVLMGNIAALDYSW